MTHESVKPSGLTRYTLVEPGDWELLNGDGNQRLHARAVKSEEDEEDELTYDIFLQSRGGQALFRDIKISRAALLFLRTSLRYWLSQPLAKMAKAPFTAGVDLAAQDWQYLQMTFGPTDDALMSTGETHCHVKIGTEWELLGEVRLITNPTCLEALAEGVEVVLGVRKDTPIDSSIMAAAIHEGLTRTATE